jgi:hypothetical protein
MKQENKNPGAGGTARGAKDTTQQPHFSAQNSALIEAYLTRSRGKSSVVVAGQAHFKMLGRVLNNEDACRAVALANRLEAGFVVLAGQLHKAKAGCFAVVIRDVDDFAQLNFPIVAAYNKLTELGETDSFWIIAVEGEARERVNAVLATLSATEGAA